MDQSIDRLIQQLLGYPNNSSSLGIRATTIPDGIMKGKVVIEVVTKAGFRLLDLPRELRERIYDFTFERPGKLEIKDISWYKYDRMNGRWPSGNKGNKHRKVIGAGLRDKQAHLGQDWDSNLAKWIGGKPSEFSLLLTNKQIHAEATPTAYRANHCVFRTRVTTSLPMFLNVIGPSIKYLQEISIGNDDRPHKDLLSLAQLRDHLVVLKAATGLRKLYLVPDKLVLLWAKVRAKDPSNPDSWACAFNKIVSNFLLDLKKAYKASGWSWKAADVIQFVDTGRPSETEKQQLAQFEAAFREIARGYLED
ncbi:hypothetical protein Slin15195_G032670 [Septoria linicola]|uniref:Uncharacterized protein n=1 Tax=Septoria linicola TaxID=215465 RepID=A0A9Q9APP7_9PEZI|nr:hypothetical protein Slin14017_G031700 [Septoria linicola]USW49948.1 hypothetical protein Slin15195_G032670 [Septoria linicola]